MRCVLSPKIAVLVLPLQASIIFPLGAVEDLWELRDTGNGFIQICGEIIDSFVVKDEKIRAVLQNRKTNKTEKL